MDDYPEWHVYKAHRSEFIDGEHVLVSGDTVIRGKTLSEVTSEQRRLGLIRPSLIFTVSENDVVYHEAQLKVPFSLAEDEESALRNIIQKIEARINRPVKLTLAVPNADNVEIKSPPKRRNGITIYAAKTAYKELEGDYQTIEDVNARIKQLHEADFGPPCVKCGRIVGSIRVRIMNASLVSDENCSCLLTMPRMSKWGNVVVQLDEGYIYTHGGGSISVCTTIALIK